MDNCKINVNKIVYLIYELSVQTPVISSAFDNDLAILIVSNWFNNKKNANLVYLNESKYSMETYKNYHYP